MQIRIQISPQFEDLILVANLVNRLADLSTDPEAKNLRRDIISRLKRLKRIDSVANFDNAIPWRESTGNQGTSAGTLDARKDRP